MKSTLDILSALFKLVNVPAVTNVITGKVYIGTPPDTSQLEDIGLNTLTNPKAYLQTGFANLNLFTKEVESGRADLARIKELINIIMPLVEDAVSDGVFFQIDDDKGNFKDDDKDSMYYYNLRLTFQTL
ncbi:hypothetical protein [Aestuariibaculum marinum]|uniref:DUF3168 domain-containing protein n=1 Tax=Aestuariibaculum marinum TaxID=2683592 RepID=A0A8J6U176_9FLAO|nr:hypothetical protein [Aestuariibaculum marinum]MBD0822640.1 hypothetical protein [Aestuariibaculum marinum]